MKKILLSIATVFITAMSVNAQVDYGFETWVPANSGSTIENPTGWASFNIVTALNLGMQQTVYKETAAPYVGSAAAKIVTQVIPALLGVPGYDTVGILAIGKVAGTSITFGSAYTNRPANVSFGVKYQAAVAGDSASVNVFISKYNTTTKIRDVIARGVWRTADVITTWTPESIALNYDPAFNTVQPDTITIIISSSSFRTQKVGSTMYIDDIKFSGYVSTNDIAGVKNNVSVYPSPAKENVTISISVNAKAVEVIDITGRSLGVFPMTNNKATIETAKYPAGMYLYNVIGEQSNVLGRGKFEVVK